MTPPSSFYVPEVLSVQDFPTVELTMIPDSPTATNFPPDEEEEVSSSEGVSSEMVKEVTDSVLLAFPSESVTIIVQSE